MSIKKTIKELQQDVAECEKLLLVETDPHKRHIIQAKKSKALGKIKQRQNEKPSWYQKDSTSYSKRNRDTDATKIAFREVWMNTTHKDTKEDYSKYKYKELLPETLYKCSKCGKETNKRYMIDLFRLELGSVCEECNKKYYNNTLSSIE